MPTEPIKNLLPRLGNRSEYLDYLDRWTVGTVDQLSTHMTKRALVKGFLLETSRSDGRRDAVEALGIGQQVERVDDQMFRLRRSGENGDWGLVEIEDDRYPIVYTAIDSEEADRRIDNLIARSPLLDRAWFSSPLFQQLWSTVLTAHPGSRFSQIVFEHESVYEAGSDETPSVVPVDDDEDEAAAEIEETRPVTVERRRARMRITERLGRLRAAIPQMRQIYDPLESIIQLRIPAPRRGGHDVYYDGRFTNRSDSMLAFRQTVQSVTSIYRQSTEAAEELAWPRPSHTDDRVSLGMPVLIRFSQSLEPETFERWINTLRRKTNRFRLWGNPIDLGEGKVHLYAVDNHLWQPIDLELTRDHVYALLPSGTCGNTIHRLVTNIQRFVDPKLSTYIGDQSYESFLQTSSTTGDPAND